MTEPDFPPAVTDRNDPRSLRGLGLAHDVNQLLGTVLGRAQLLRESHADPETRRQLDLIITAARDSAELLNELLDESASTADGKPGTRLAEVVADCLELTRGRWETEAAQRGVRYEMSAEVPDDQVVRAPAAAVRRVLVNLLVNALEAMPAGGRVLLRGEEVETCVRLFVRDEGPGLDEVTCAQLFTPGFSAGKPRGRGLGLASCRQILAGLGGTISVTSEVGRGTTFEVVLPRGEAAAPSATDPATPLPVQAPGAQRILVVDNEPRIRDLLAEVLADDGHQVVSLTSGPEALDRHRTGRWDVVVLDLSLPGISGLEVARTLRERDPVVGIVAISGWGREILGETLGQASEDGVVDLVAAKPLDIQKIRELVSRAAAAASRRRAASAEAGA